MGHCVAAFWLIVILRCGEKELAAIFEPHRIIYRVHIVFIIVKDCIIYWLISI